MSGNRAYEHSAEAKSIYGDSSVPAWLSRARCGRLDAPLPRIAAREVAHRPRVPDPLRHFLHAGDDIGQPLPASEAQSDRPVAREVARTGEDEIPEAGQAVEGLPFPTEPNREAGDLRQPAGDEC